MEADKALPGAIAQMLGLWELATGQAGASGMKPSPITSYIDNGKGARLIIGEHPDSVFIAMDRAGFFSRDEAMEAASALIAIARKLRKRAK